MTTATVIVNDALRLLNLNSGILPVDPRNQDAAFRIFVDLLNGGLGDNIRILRQMPASISAELYEPGWATRGLKEMLARAAAPFLQADVPANLGDEGERILRNRARPSIACSMPDTLPVGGGNSHFLPNKFYQEPSYIFDVFSEVSLDESRTHYADFGPDATQRGTSVSSVAWSTVSGVAVGISSASVSGNLASAVLSFTAEGVAVVRAVATYANGQKQNFTFDITVTA